MVSFIVLFFPAVLTIWIFESLSKTDLRPKYFAVFYAASVLLINTICFLVLYYILDWGQVSLHDPQEGMSVYYAVRYLTLAVPMSVFVGIAAAFLRKYIRIEIEEAEDGED